MTKGQTSIGIVTAFGATAMVLFGWNGFNSLKIITQGEQAASIMEWQKNFTQSSKDYQDATDKKSEKISDDVGQLKIDVATTKELMKLVSDRYQINTAAVEARVINEVRNEEFSSSTAQK